MKMCRDCDAEWTGQNICHCAAAGCHRTFSVVAHFDSHRVRDKCVDPSTITKKVKDETFSAMKLNAHGVWVGAIPNPRFAEETE